MKFIAVDLAGEGKLNPEIRNMIPENVRLVYCGGSGCIKSKCKIRIFGEFCRPL